MKPTLEGLLAQLKTVREHAQGLYLEAEAELERLESQSGPTAKVLEAQTRRLERLESLVECLDEALNPTSDD